MPQPEYPQTPRTALAARVTDVLCHRHSAEILAIGAHGSLARGDDADGSDVGLVAVTYRRSSAVRSVLRRVDGILVDLTVVAADEHLRQARALTSWWPLHAGRYLDTRPTHDPQGFFGALRETHLGRLAEARPPEFSALAREAWCRAATAHGRAVRLAEWYDTDAALVLLAEARLQAALVVGLLSRTHFRNTAEAVRRTGTAGADMSELASVLKGQAEELTGRGQPVDGPLSSLFG